MWRRHSCDIWLALMGILSLCSVPLYLLAPAGSVQQFGGDVRNSTASFWCSTVAAGDAVCAYLCHVTLRLNAKTEIKSRQTMCRAIGLYCTLHFFCFFYGTWLLDPQPCHVWLPLLATCVVSAVCWLHFGFQCMPGTSE